MNGVEVSFSIVAPVEEVYGLLTRPQPLAGWWRDLLDLHQIRPGVDGSVVGTAWRARFRGVPGPRDVSIEVIQCDPGCSVAWSLHGGLGGTIFWSVRASGSITTVRALWTVSSTGPVLLRVHRDAALLRRAGEGIARQLRAGLVQQPSFRGRGATITTTLVR